MASYDHGAGTFRRSLPKDAWEEATSTGFKTLTEAAKAQRDAMTPAVKASLDQANPYPAIINDWHGESFADLVTGFAAKLIYDYGTCCVGNWDEVVTWGPIISMVMPVDMIQENAESLASTLRLYSPPPVELAKIQLKKEAKRAVGGRYLALAVYEEDNGPQLDSEVQRDIYGVLRKNPAETQNVVLRRLDEAGTPHGEGDVKTHLSRMKKDGVLEALNESNNRGYRLSKRYGLSTD